MLYLCAMGKDAFIKFRISSEEKTYIIDRVGNVSKFLRGIVEAINGGNTRMTIQDIINKSKNKKN